jgi:putative signal transducing protein
MSAPPLGANDLKKLYSAASLPDAHLIRNLLDQAGIEAHVFNENAQGGVGQLPVMDAYPQVWIVNERDLERARQIVETFERMPSIRSNLRCARCSEDNPSTFQLCWKCGESLS